jgi:hypothetical protein
MTSKVLPPLLLLFLIFIPYDVGALLFWLPGGVLAFISIVKLLVLLFKGFKSKNLEYKFCVRPALTILIFSICVYSIDVSRDDARKEAMAETARIAEKYDGNYPEHIVGWDKEKYESENSYNYVGWPAARPLSYIPSEDKASFEMRLYVDFDNVYTYSYENGSVVETLN